MISKRNRNLWRDNYNNKLIVFENRPHDRGHSLMFKHPVPVHIDESRAGGTGGLSCKGAVCAGGIENDDSTHGRSYYRLDFSLREEFDECFEVFSKPVGMFLPPWGYRIEIGRPAVGQQPRRSDQRRHQPPPV